MISGNNHKWTKDYILISGIFYFCDNGFAGSIFRLTFYCSDEYILISKLFHLCLHLRIADLCCMRCSMSHEYKCCAVLCCCIKAVIFCCLYCFCSDCLSYCSLVFIDCCCVRSNFSEKWFCDFNRFEFIFVTIYCFC